MPKLAPRFNWGAEVKNINTILYNQLSDSYTDIAEITNTKSSKYVTTKNPDANSQTNLNFDVGDLWVNSTTDTAWIMTSRSTNTSVTWTQIT